MQNTFQLQFGGKSFNSLLKMLAVASVVVITTVTLAAPLDLEQLAKQSLNLKSKRRIGVEAEFAGFGSADVELLLSQLGSFKAVYSRSDDAFTLIDDNAGILIKPEYNESIQDEYLEENFVWEMVSKQPIKLTEIKDFDRLLRKLKMIGAQGVESGKATSIHITIELLGEVEQKTNEAVAALKAFNHPDYHSQILAYFNPAPQRRHYIQPLTRGFRDKLLQEDYWPSPQTFLVDYLYRQSLERLGVSKAWTRSEYQVRQKISELDWPLVLAVIKLNDLRASSFLAWAFPEDPLVQKMLASEWVSASPTIEYRASDNNFRIEKVAKVFFAFFQWSQVRNCQNLLNVEAGL